MPNSLVDVKDKLNMQTYYLSKKEREKGGTVNAEKNVYESR